MANNLDIWAIQYYPEELTTALNKIGDGLNIIYSNLVSELKVGNNIISGRNFDTILYNEESDILILLMTGGKVTKEDIINYLEENNKRYVEVTFNPCNVIDLEDKDKLPEMWFARDLSVIEDAIKDSAKNNFLSCTLYINITASINFNYKDNNGDRIDIDSRIIKKIIRFEDKVIFITKNINVKDIIEILKKYNIIENISYKKTPRFYKKDFSKKILKRI